MLIHAHESLNIGEFPILLWKNGDNYEEWKIARIFRYPEYEFYVVEADEVLPAGEIFADFERAAFWSSDDISNYRRKFPAEF